MVAAAEHASTATSATAPRASAGKPASDAAASATAAARPPIAGSRYARVANADAGTSFRTIALRRGVKKNVETATDCSERHDAATTMLAVPGESQSAIASRSP